MYLKLTDEAGMSRALPSILIMFMGKYSTMKHVNQRSRPNSSKSVFKNTNLYKSIFGKIIIYI